MLQEQVINFIKFHKRITLSLMFCNSYLHDEWMRVDDHDFILTTAPEFPCHRYHASDGRCCIAYYQNLLVLKIPTTAFIIIPPVDG